MREKQSEREREQEKRHRRRAVTLPLEFPDFSYITETGKHRSRGWVRAHV